MADWLGSPMLPNHSEAMVLMYAGVLVVWNPTDRVSGMVGVSDEKSSFTCHALMLWPEAVFFVLVAFCAYIGMLSPKTQQSSHVYIFVFI